MSKKGSSDLVLVHLTEDLLNSLLRCSIFILRLLTLQIRDNLGDVVNNLGDVVDNLGDVVDNLGDVVDTLGDVVDNLGGV